MTTANSNTTSRAANGTPSLQELVLAKKAELEAQLRALDTLNIEKLLGERAETAARLVELDGRIAEVRAQLGLAADDGRPGRRAAAGHGSGAGEGGVRVRLSSQEIRGRIAKALTEEERAGLSQLQIAERTGIAYGTVAAYLKANAASFRTTGHLKAKRYFLK